MTTVRRPAVGRSAAMVRPTPTAIAALTPIGGEGVSLTGGFWGERLTTNHDRTIPHGFEQLERAGNFSNLRLAAGAHGRYRALGEDIGVIFPFLDTDVYKWLEAVGWELGRDPSPALARQGDEAIALVERAQRSDGYLNSYVQVVAPGSEYRDLAWGHELYSFGHLIQAAVAWQRALGDDRLLGVATRAADAVDRELGPAGRSGIDGHPEIEMALVELFRTTGERRYLELAARFVEARGAGPPRGRAIRPGVLAGSRSRSRRTDGRRPRRSTALPRLRRGRRRHGAGRSAAPRCRHAALAGHGRDPDVPDRRPRQPPP